MARVVGVHGIAQQYRSGPELTLGWLYALRDGLEVAGFRATADSLAETDVRVAYFGDLVRPRGAIAGGEPPYTPADVRPGPEQDLLECWYQAAVEQEPSLGATAGGDGTRQSGGPSQAAPAAVLPHFSQWWPSVASFEAGDRLPQRPRC
jgi:hypothetical protein